MRAVHIAFAAALVTAHTAANAWFFFFIPGGAVSAIGDKLAGVEGEHCVSSQAKVGDTIRLPDGNSWKVASLSGASSRCNTPQFPVRAKLDRIFTASEAQQEFSVCIAMGRSAGQRVYVASMAREMEVVRTTASMDCQSTPQTPVQAMVRHPGTTSQAASLLQPGQECVAAIFKTGDEYGASRIASLQEGAAVCAGGTNPHLATLIPRMATQPANLPAPEQVKEPALRSTIERLRELKQLRDENLITQEVYEAKQREILSAN